MTAGKNWRAEVCSRACAFGALLVLMLALGMRAQDAKGAGTTSDPATPPAAATATHPADDSSAISPAPAPKKAKHEDDTTTPIPPAPAAVQPKPTLNDFAWLAGRWQGAWGPRVAQQIVDASQGRRDVRNIPGGRKRQHPRYRAFHAGPKARRHQALLPPLHAHSRPMGNVYANRAESHQLDAESRSSSIIPSMASPSAPSSARSTRTPTSRARRSCPKRAIRKSSKSPTTDRRQSPPRSIDLLLTRPICPAWP